MSLFTLIPQVNRSATDAGGEFVTALAERNADDSYDLLAGESKAQLSRQDWKTWVDFTFENYDGGKPELTNQQPIAELGNVYNQSQEPTRLTYRFYIQGRPRILPLVLVKESGAWKVHEIGSFRDADN